MSSGHSNNFANQFMAKAADGNSRTFGKSKGKKTSPWFSAKASSTPISAVTVTPDTKNKASKVKKYLKGFEIWVGATAGDKAVKCGGPFAWSVIKRGPVTAQCAAAAPTHSYVTVVLPGRKKTLGFGEIELH